MFLLADPAVRTLSDPIAGQLPLPDHVAGVLYGPAPTAEQSFAVNAAFMTFAALPSFVNLSDEQLAPILNDALHRVLWIR